MSQNLITKLHPSPYFISPSILWGFSGFWVYGSGGCYSSYIDSSGNSALSVCSGMSNSLRPRGLEPARLFCPWDFPGKNTGVGCHFLLQGNFPTQGLNPGLLHLLPEPPGLCPVLAECHWEAPGRRWICRQVLYRWGTWEASQWEQCWWIAELQSGLPPPGTASSALSYLIITTSHVGWSSYFTCGETEAQKNLIIHQRSDSQ